MNTTPQEILDDPAFAYTSRPTPTQTRIVFQGRVCLSVSEAFGYLGTLRRDREECAREGMAYHVRGGWMCTSLCESSSRPHVGEPPHVDYPHPFGTLHDCPGCESRCHAPTIGKHACVHCAGDGGQ